ncbi:unnamed protein product [Penicillium camemberti]|uniref:Str. FM013 n=1 Tax=Penicillium camemberti (strain FM 013) TaxID=1429867 RepID=A0A0G4P0H7_PENC3|nr:unnamed protein product [Penicillium camemberti]
MVLHRISQDKASSWGLPWGQKVVLTGCEFNLMAN